MMNVVTVMTLDLKGLNVSTGAFYPMGGGLLPQAWGKRPPLGKILKMSFYPKCVVGFLKADYMLCTNIGTNYLT